LARGVPALAHVAQKIAETWLHNLSMEPNLASVVRDWHELYSLVGTASARLLFVAASVGANVFSTSDQQPMKAYLTPTVAHFSSLLFICILFLIPTQTWLSLSMTLGGLGIIGIAYSLRHWVRALFTLRCRIDLADRVFYVLVPGLGYLLVVVFTVTLFEHQPLSAKLTAAALIVLLLAGIRNAWDMTVWIITRSQTRA
jgi:hypothetical protein